MKITNKSNLPDAIVQALANDPYDNQGSDYTITDLLKPPRQLALTREHHHEIEEDAADMIYRLYGQITHQILERAGVNALTEKRFFAEFLGKKISGQIDTLSNDGVLSDYKFSTAFKFKTTPDADWIAQLNMQLELLRRNGLEASKIQIVGLVRDFRHKESREISDYPKAPIVIVDIPIWPRALTNRYIESRIILHEDAKVELPECSAHERWAKDDVYAVMRNKRAMVGGLKSSEKAAVEMHKLNPGTYIEKRKGHSARCAQYCLVSKFCSQFRQTVNT